MSGADKQTDETTALLVSYAAGTATEAERAEVEARIENDPDVAARLALAQSSRQAIEQRASAEAREWSPGELGFRRLMRDIDRETPPARTGWADSLALWRGVAAAAVIALIAVSAWPGEERAGGSGSQGARGVFRPVIDPVDGGALAQIAFRPTAAEAEIRALLIETRATLINGPSALGLYRISFDSVESRDAALARMRAADVVESVNAE